MRNVSSSLAAAVVIGLLSAAPASAESVFTLHFGSFSPHSDAVSRGLKDTFVHETAVGDLDLAAFKHFTVGFDQLFTKGEHVEIGWNAGYYKQTVADVRFISRNTITNDLLIAPIAATVRYLPLGEDAKVHPYVGGGVGVNLWQVGYKSTSGVDESGFGFGVGPVIVLGARVPLGASATSIGGEMRWQGGRGKFPTDSFFSGEEVDLGGLNLLLTLSFLR
jgi:outer membrane protein W